MCNQYHVLIIKRAYYNIYVLYFNIKDNKCKINIYIFMNYTDFKNSI